MEIRPKLWLGKDRLWLRKRDGQQHFALKFIPCEDNRELSSMVVKALGECTQSAAEHHAEWFIRRFSQYAWRTQIEVYLTGRLATESPYSIAEMAMECTRPDGPFLRRCVPLSFEQKEQFRVPPSEIPESKLDSSDAIPRPKRSRYLENLLK